MITMKLLQIVGEAPACEIVLRHFPAIIGRSVDVDLVLLDPRVSRRHCQIEEAGGRFFMRDLESTNGVWINGLRVAQSPLMPGDKLRLGDSVFVISYDRPQHCLVAVRNESSVGVA